jgi:adenosylmethionine-8-amino-7-oxononanoate aminotransferase
VQQTIERDGLLERVRSLGALLERRLRDAFGGHPNVGDIRGRGLFWGVEFVADRASKRPFDPALKLNAQLKQAALAQGLLVYPMGGTIDGRHGDHVLLAPPLILADAQVDEIVERLARAFESTLGALPASAQAARA